MDARRARTLVATGLALALLLSAWAGPVAAAECALSEPVSPRVGTPLTINGTGFPVSTAVDIALTIGSAAPDEFSVQSDGAGTFVLSLTPEANETGPTTVIATVGASCTAQVEFAVLGADDPDPSAVPSGAAASASTDPAPPRTDTAAAGGSGASETRQVPWWLLAAMTLVVGVIGLRATRPPRNL